MICTVIQCRHYQCRHYSKKYSIKSESIPWCKFMLIHKRTNITHLQVPRFISNTWLKYVSRMPGRPDLTSRAAQKILKYFCVHEDLFIKGMYM